MPGEVRQRRGGRGDKGRAKGDKKSEQIKLSRIIARGRRYLDLTPGFVSDHCKQSGADCA